MQYIGFDQDITPGYFQKEWFFHRVVYPFCSVKVKPGMIEKRRITKETP